MNNAAMADQGDAVRKNYNGAGTYNQELVSGTSGRLARLGLVCGG